MFSKVVTVFGLLAVAYCQDHSKSYILKSVVKHEQPKKVQAYQAIPLAYKSTSDSGSNGYSHGHAISSQSIIHHGYSQHESQDNSHNAQYVVPTHYQYAPVQQTLAIHSAPVYEPAPVHETVRIHATPVQIQSGEHKNPHAVSSQNIVRYDSHQSQGNSGYYAPVEYHHVAPVQHTLNIHATPIQESGHKESYEKEYYTHPKYEFEYKVEDPHTKDIKFQHEARDGDVVKGIYSLHEADGTIRTVKYSADKHSGFNAHVDNSGATKHIEQQQQYHH